MSAANIKILWVAHERDLSGANMCMLEFIEILQDAQITNMLVVPGEGDVQKRAESLGVSVRILKFYPWAKSVDAGPDSLQISLRKKLRNLTATIQIKKIIATYEPDYIVTNTITFSVAAKAAKKTRKKHIWFVHEFGEEDHGFTIAGKFSRGAALINRLSEKVVFNSRATKEKFSPFINNEKMCIVYYPVELSIPGPSISLQPSFAFRLIMIGQIAPSKNQLDAIRALAICKSRGLDVMLTIVGKTVSENYMEKIQALIGETDLGNYVHFAGLSDRPAMQLVQSHALLMCSRMEAFGRVTVEALKCGVPVIAADTGGTTEIIEEGVNGYFYESGNVEDLAEKIMRLYRNYTSVNKESIAARAGARFNVEQTKRGLLNVFN